MEISIKEPHLQFLIGDVTQASEIPIRVIHFARLRLQTIEAMTQPNNMKKWKSLDYRSDDDGEDGSIAIIDDWRLGLKSDPNKIPPTITVINLWRISNDS